MKKGVLLVLAAATVFACSKNAEPADPKTPDTKGNIDFSFYVSAPWGAAAPFYGGEVELEFAGVTNAYYEVSMDFEGMNNFIIKPVPDNPTHLILYNAYWDRGDIYARFKRTRDGAYTGLTITSNVGEVPSDSVRLVGSSDEPLYMPEVGSTGFLLIVVRPDGGKWRLSPQTISQMAGQYKIVWSGDPYDSIRTQGKAGLYNIVRVGKNAPNMDIPLYTTRGFDYPAATIKARSN